MATACEGNLIQTILGRVVSIHCDATLQTMLERFLGKSGVEFVDTVDALFARRMKHLSLIILQAADSFEDCGRALGQLRSAFSGPVIVVNHKEFPKEFLDALDPAQDVWLVQPVHAGLLELALTQAARKYEMERKVEEISRKAELCRAELDQSMQRQNEMTAEKDVTYRELMHAYSRLQDVNQKRNNFLAQATHELRTPVTVMKGYHRILLDERLGKLRPEQRKVLLESEESCSRLIKIINSLLDLSRIEAGKLELIYQDNDFADNIKQVAIQFRQSCRRKRVSMSVRVDKRIPRFSYDRDKICQAVSHLLENSVKHTPAGGKIQLLGRPCFWDRRTSGSVEADRASRPLGSGPSLSPRPAFNAVQVEICDTGVGISQEHAQEIFDEFFQASSNQVTRPGLGLGLAISKKIIDAHGGQIWLDSQAKSGSKFVFLLPFAPIHAPTN